MRRRWAVDNERGQTLALAAAAVTVMLGLSAVAIDLGRLFSARAEAQRAADAAALAGASQFYYYTPAQAVPFADSAARAFAKLNRIQQTLISDADIVSVTPNAANLTVRVVIQRANIRNWFASTIGVRNSTVNAAATAQLSPAGAAQCIKPIAIPDLWQEPAAGGADSLHPNGVGNRVWDIPPPPTAGNNYPSVPPIEAWRYTGTSGQSFAGGNAGYGTTYRDGRAGQYQTAKSADFGRRLVLMIEAPSGSSGVSIQPSSFYQAWGISNGGGNSPGGTSAASIAAGIRDPNCGIATAETGTTYRAANGIGAGQIGNAWDDLYNLDPNATWDDQNNKVINSNKCPSSGPCLPEHWMESPRVITVGVYDPTVYGTSPSNNAMAFRDFATVFVEKPFTVGPGGSPKRWVTGVLLRYNKGLGGGTTSGNLNRVLRLIK
jgi:Flp pilus assembly protein TadG